MFSLRCCNSAENTKILESNQYWKSDKTPSMIYADLESLVKVVDGCKHDSKNSSATKGGEYVSCEYSMSKIGTFDGLEDNHDIYRGQD